MNKIDTYVDTCFLMNPAGRSYVLNNRLRVKIIHAVQRELARHGTNPEAIKAQAVIMSNPELFEKLTAERVEETERRLYHQEKDASADRIFRTMAIRCQDFGKKMCLLTADSALADALSVYEGVSIMFIDSYDKSRVVQEWLAYKSERVKQAQREVSSFLAEKDIVLSSSGLQSAGLRQFLRDDRDLERAGHPGEGDVVLFDSVAKERILRAADEFRDDEFVESCCDDSDLDVFCDDVSFKSFHGSVLLVFGHVMHFLLFGE